MCQDFMDPSEGRLMIEPVLPRPKAQYWYVLALILSLYEMTVKKT